MNAQWDTLSWKPRLYTYWRRASATSGERPWGSTHHASRKPYLERSHAHCTTRSYHTSLHTEPGKLLPLERTVPVHIDLLKQLAQILDKLD